MKKILWKRFLHLAQSICTKKSAGRKMLSKNVPPIVHLVIILFSFQIFCHHGCLTQTSQPPKRELTLIKIIFFTDVCNHYRKYIKVANVQLAPGWVISDSIDIMSSKLHLDISFLNFIFLSTNCLFAGAFHIYMRTTDLRGFDVYSCRKFNGN